MPTAKPISIAIAGSTQYTRWCAETLATDPDFSITHILTPTPRLIGRKQTLTQNPLHAWAIANNIPCSLIGERADQTIRAALLTLPKPDILLVVDFGYFIPKWLLEWPVVGPLNIHPSALPRWRGSSPGQFPLLYGDDTSAVTLMIMNEAFDAGPLLQQIPFMVDPNWTAQEYYQHAFKLITQQLPTLLKEFATGQLSPTPQPEESPTPVARKLNRDDGFVSWSLFQRLIAGTQVPDQCDFHDVSPALLDTFSATGNIYLVVERAIRALSPWPGIWTEVPTAVGRKRLKILSSRLEHDAEIINYTLTPYQVQLEGKQPTYWNQIKGTLKIETIPTKV